MGELIQDGRPGAAPDYTWVDTPAGYRNLLGHLDGVRRIALDMESDSLYHYFEKVCLIQVSTDRATFVLDPLALADLKALGELTRDPAIEKVFHAASYDVSSLRRDYSFAFSNIFDTHVAAQLLGYEQLGLDALLELLLGVVHSKRYQRDDWSRRPLAAEQRAYAAMDTHHLLPLRDRLAEHLLDKGRLPWAQEEFQVIAESGSLEKQFDPEGYRRIRGSRDLKPREMAVLRALYVLRDKYARAMDQPPFKVMNDSVLMSLTREPPESPGRLLRRPGISYRVARNFADEICRAVARARTQIIPPAAHTSRSQLRPLSREARERASRLKAWRQAKARDLQLSVGVVFPGYLLEAIAAAPPADQAALEAMDGMRRWRGREFGGEILDLVRTS
jgi:ribonuclease D